MLFQTKHYRSYNNVFRTTFSSGIFLVLQLLAKCLPVSQLSITYLYMPSWISCVCCVDLSRPVILLFAVVSSGLLLRRKFLGDLVQLQPKPMPSFLFFVLLLVEKREGNVSPSHPHRVCSPFYVGKQCRERWLNHLDPHIKKVEIEKTSRLSP